MFIVCINIYINIIIVMRIIRYILGFPGGLLMVVASISEEIYKNRWFRNNVWSSGDRQVVLQFVKSRIAKT